MPDAALVAAVDHLMRTFTDDVAAHVSRGIADLPNYDLEDGTVLDAERYAA